MAAEAICDIAITRLAARVAHVSPHVPGAAAGRVVVKPNYRKQEMVRARFPAPGDAQTTQHEYQPRKLKRLADGSARSFLGPFLTGRGYNRQKQPRAAGYHSGRRERLPTNPGAHIT